MRLLGNFDSEGKLEKLHTSPPKSNSCNSEKDRMLDQRELSMREAIQHAAEATWEFDDKDSDIRFPVWYPGPVDRILCDHCFGEDEG